MKLDPEFYIGYLPRAPRELAATIRRLTSGVLTGAALLAAVLSLSQNRFPDAVFEFGTMRRFAGLVHERPFPSIDLNDGRQAVLVAPGKHGAGSLIEGFDGHGARMEGTRIERDGTLMIEIAPGSVRASGAATSAGDWTVVETGAELSGEIVDSKCWLGVMNPGEGKVHRDCAARCISGGVPPAFLVRDAAGTTRLLILTGHRDAGQLLDYVAEPVTVRGSILRRERQWRFDIDPATIRRAR